jgi:hypothetical protein
MPWLKWIIVVIALTEAGWMSFDGTRALLVGDYVTPKQGQYAGQPGPWANLVTAMGIEPRSTPMKSIFVIYGVAWLFIIVAFSMNVRWAWWAMLFAAIGSLWYLVIGTMTSVVVIALLLLPAVRRAYS